MDSHTVGFSVLSGEKARPLFIRSPLTEKTEQDWASGGLLRIGTWFQARVFHHTPKKEKAHERRNDDG